jgi:hypothetical protein
MSLLFTTQANNNGIVTAKNGMPFKPNTMTQGSDFSNFRNIFNRTAPTLTKDQVDPRSQITKIRNNAWDSSSDYIARRKAKAVGKSSFKVGLPQGSELSFKSTDSTYRNSVLAKARGAGSVAPKKKTSILNTFASGGSNTYKSSGVGVRVIQT